MLKRKEKASCFMCIAECIYNRSIRPSGIINNCLFGSYFLKKITRDRLKLPEDEQIVWSEFIRMLSKQKNSSEEGFYHLFKWPL